MISPISAFRGSKSNFGRVAVREEDSRSSRDLLAGGLVAEYREPHNVLYVFRNANCLPSVARTVAETSDTMFLLFQAL